MRSTLFVFPLLLFVAACDTEGGSVTADAASVDSAADTLVRPADVGINADLASGAELGPTADLGPSSQDWGTGVPGSVIKDSVSGRVWPGSHGESMVCLWQDDKLGAISFTIDDNSAPDHPWWVAQGKAFGFKFTWFVITGKVGSGYFGTWSGFAQLLAQGHDIQSHTVTHLDKSLTIDQEYKDSAAAIEANIPGAEVLALAYPGGTNSSMNDPAVAKKYYVGARGVSGLHNQATKINYMQTNSLSAIWTYKTDHWASLNNIVTYNPKQTKSYRAWQCMHFHAMKTTARADAITGFNWVKAHAAEIWPALFREVILYGQERDAATLTVPLVNSNTVVLSLTDTLADKVFNYPLTIKVGLDVSWTKVTAQQGGKAVPVKLVLHGGKTYALVSAVPDAGQIVLKKQN